MIDLIFQLRTKFDFKNEAILYIKINHLSSYV